MQLLGEFYDFKSKLLESEEKIINGIQGRTIAEKTSRIICWFMHNEVTDKPKSTVSSKSKQKRGNKVDTEKQKAISIESTQEDKSNLPSVGCRIRMLVGYDDKGIMNTTIITPKEDVDQQFWYPKRNKVINK